MAPVIGPKVQEKITSIAPISVHFLFPVATYLTTNRTMLAPELKPFSQWEMPVRF